MARSIQDYGRANQRSHHRQTSPSKLEPDELVSETFSDIDDKTMQYCKKKNLTSKQLSSVGHSSLNDSKPHSNHGLNTSSLPPAATSTGAQPQYLSKNSVQTSSHSNNPATDLHGPIQALPVHSQAASQISTGQVDLRGSARDESRGGKVTSGGVAKSQRTPTDVKEYISCYKSENQKLISIYNDSSPEPTARDEIDQKEVIVDIGKGTDQVKYQGEKEPDFNKQLTFSQNDALDLNSQYQNNFAPGQFSSSHTKTDRAGGYGQNIKISTLLHKHSERQRSKQQPSGYVNDNQSSYNGDKTLTSQDHQWGQTSKFCVEDADNYHDFSEKQAYNKDQGSTVGNQTVEKAYESKKIQEYADRAALEVQDSSQTELNGEIKPVEELDRRASQDETLTMNQFSRGSQQLNSQVQDYMPHNHHSTNQNDTRHAGKIIKQLYRSTHNTNKPDSTTFPVLSSSLTTTNDNNNHLMEAKTYGTNISSMYLEERIGATTNSNQQKPPDQTHGGPSTNQLSNSQSSMNIGQMNRKREQQLESLADARVRNSQAYLPTKPQGAQTPIHRSFDENESKMKQIQSKSDLHSPQLSFVDSTLENDTSQKRLQRSNNQNGSRYLDSIDVTQPSQSAPPQNLDILEEKVSENEESNMDDGESQSPSQSSLKINDILKFKKLPEIQKHNQDDRNINELNSLEDQRLQKMVQNFDEIKAQHKEMQYLIKANDLQTAKNRPHQRSVQSTIHEVSNGCQIEDTPEILSKNQESERNGAKISGRQQGREPKHTDERELEMRKSPYDNVVQLASFQNTGRMRAEDNPTQNQTDGYTVQVNYLDEKESEDLNLKKHQQQQEQPFSVSNNASNIQFLDDYGSEIDVQLGDVSQKQVSSIDQLKQETGERTQPVLQVFQNPKYKKQNNKSSYNSRHSSINQVSKQKPDEHLQIMMNVPDQNLMVVCYIKQPNKRVRANSGTQFDLRKRSSKSNPRVGRFSRPLSQNRVGSVQSERTKSVYSARSAKNGRDLESFRQSIASSKFSVNDVLSNDYGIGGSTSFTNPSNHSTTYNMHLKIKESLKGPNFFTTQKESSQLVFQQLSTLTQSYQASNSQSLSKNIISNGLRYANDCPAFLAGTFKQSRGDDLDESIDKNQKGSNLRMFSFDKCLSDSQHSKSIVYESRQFLRNWFIHSKVNQTIESVFPLNDTEDPILKFCFMFGSQATQKSEELNLMNKNSLIQEFINDMFDPIRYLQISMFFQDQEFVLNNREFDSNKQSKREIGMEIREAIRDRMRLVNKLTEQQPDLALFIQKCSHFKIQINNYVFIDMADLRGLQYFENEEVVSTLTNDFGSMTNEILRQSVYYRDHSFQINEDQQLSSFNQFLRNNIQPQSKIMLLTFISNEAEELVSSQIALDFSHKIRQYFSGQSDECAIKNIIESNRFNCDPVKLTEAFDKVEYVFVQLELTKRQVEKIDKKSKNPQNQVSKICFKKMARDFNTLRERFEQYEQSLQQSLENEISPILPPGMLADFTQKIQRDTQIIKDSIRETGCSINKLSNRVMSLNPPATKSTVSKLVGPSLNNFLQKPKTITTALQLPKAQPRQSQNNSLPSKRQIVQNPNEKTLSQKSSQVSLQNYNPIRARGPGTLQGTKNLTQHHPSQLKHNSQTTLPAFPPYANGTLEPSTANTGGITPITGLSTLAAPSQPRLNTLSNIPSGPQIILEPQSLPQTEESASQRGGGGEGGWKANQIVGAGLQRVQEYDSGNRDIQAGIAGSSEGGFHHRRNSSQRMMSKTQQKKSSTRLSRPKQKNPGSKKGSKKNSRKNSTNNSSKPTKQRDSSFWRKQKITDLKSSMEPSESVFTQDLQTKSQEGRGRDQLSKDIDESLKVIKSRHSAISCSKTRQYLKNSNNDLANVAHNADTFSQNDIQVIPEKQPAQPKQQTHDATVSKERIEQSISVHNPFDNDSSSQHIFAPTSRPMDLYAPPTTKHVDAAGYLLTSSMDLHCNTQATPVTPNSQMNEPQHIYQTQLNFTSQPHPSATSDLNSALRQSQKSIDLLDATSRKNNIHMLQQLQEKVHQLQQQLQFQKKEFDVKMEEKVLLSIQSRDDLLQQLNRTKKELDNANKEKREVVCRFEGRVKQLKQQAKEEIEKAKKEAKRSESKSQSIERLRKQVHSEVRQQVKNELFQTIKAQARQELQAEMRKEIEKDLKPKMLQKAKKELFEQVYSEVHDRIKEKTRQELVKQLRSDLRKEIQEEIMKESNFNHLHFELEQHQKVNQKLQSENGDLKKRLKELEQKVKKQDQSKKNVEKIEHLQKQLEAVQNEKENVEVTNRQILAQVGLMKETVKEQKEREILNIKLHEKIREKQQKIDDMKSQQKHLIEQTEHMNQQIYKYKEEQNRLNGLVQQQKLAIKDLSEQQENSRVRQEEIEEMSQQMEEMKAQLAAKRKQAQEQSRSYQDQIEELKCARDRYRQQTLDQKQELRKVKNALSLTSNSAQPRTTSSATAGSQEDSLVRGGLGSSRQGEKAEGRKEDEE